MKDLTVPSGGSARKAEMLFETGKWALLLSLLFYPVGVIRIWRVKGWIIAKCAYTVVGLVLFLISVLYLGVVVFGMFLPPLDKHVGTNLAKTIYNTEGNYSATFVKTANDTQGAYELVEVELEPYGGNEWHYHNTFSEQFTVLEGQVRIGHDGDELLLNKGQTALATKETMHFFMNATGDKARLMVKTVPAAGLEKTLRVAYGLINDGKLKNDMTENPWHMALLLGYSETYLKGLPGWFQEPLITALARIAQWRGEDKELYKYIE